MVHRPMQRGRTVDLCGIDIGLLVEKRSKCSFVAFHDRIGYIRAAGSQTHSCDAKNENETKKDYPSNHYVVFSEQLPSGNFEIGRFQNSPFRAASACPCYPPEFPDEFRRDPECSTGDFRLAPSSYRNGCDVHL